MQGKGYKGLAMEGVIATWYAKNTGRDRRRFLETAQAVSDRAPAGGRVLEVAPGPGYLAIELAKRGYRVTAVDISRTFVRIVRDNAARAGVAVDVRLGDAAALPFADGSFDVVVCTAAFKNFSDPVGALVEMRRVLDAGGHASIYDLRKEATREEIAAEVGRMRLSGANEALTRWIFRGLIKRAYTEDALHRMAGQAAFDGYEIRPSGIGFELRLTKAASRARDRAPGIDVRDT